MSAGSVYPELVTGREDGMPAGPWRIEAGSSLRGGASCDLSNRVLQVPLGGGEVARLIRAHELMHVRVSPHRPVRDFGDVSARALECAEEFRVNTLLSRAGFATTILRDGSEKAGGRSVAEANDWPEAVRFLLAVLDTGAEHEYLAGVRISQPSWMPALRAVRKRVLRFAVTTSTIDLANTSLSESGVPGGYANFTVTLARIVDRAAGSQVPGGPDELRVFRRSLEPGARRAPSGVFAKLVFDVEGITVDNKSRAHWRRSQPSVSGVVMRYPSRLLTDDMQRAFGAKKRCDGGLVIIDQSGSMDIDPGELAALVARAPGSLVVGYSHQPGDATSKPNAWILAQRGTLAHHFPSGNVGNGVDGPVLRWAIARARPNEPIVWVTDGQVTDSNDHPSDVLTAECAALVTRHRIRMVRNFAGAAPALARHRPFVHSEFGRVGRKLLENKAS